MLQLDKNKIDLDKKMIENFFNIWILKDFINDNRFEKYYNTFLDEKSIFSEELLKSKLSEIYTLITDFDVTRDNPKTIWEFTEEEIKYILGKNWEKSKDWEVFSDEINTQILWGEIEMITEWIIEDSIKRRKKIEEIKKGLNIYLEWLYNNWIYNIWTIETIDEVIKKIIEILRK